MYVVYVVYERAGVELELELELGLGRWAWSLGLVVDQWQWQGQGGSDQRAPAVPTNRTPPERSKLRSPLALEYKYLSSATGRDLQVMT